MALFDEIPQPPYLFPDPQKAARWKAKLESPNLKVALLWKGGLASHFGWRRDTELAAFAPLGQIPGVDFFSIQKGEAADDPAPPGLSLRRLSDELWDWSDTAAALSCCDLLISPDSGPLHLGGALGMPVWGLISTKYWGWVYGDDESPFYPDLRIFRKKISEPWASLMAGVTAALRALVERRERDLLAYEVA